MKVYCVYKVISIFGTEANQFVAKFYYEADAQKCCRHIMDNVNQRMGRLKSCALKVYYTEEEEE